MGRDMNTSWSITPEKVDAVIRRIVETSRPRKLVLFGSFVRGESHTHSDLDILVVARDEVDNPRQESARIRRALRGLSMPMDILVVSEDKLEELARRPDLIYAEALKSGRVVYESPGE
jgi:predicted nucleotidyltransferase